MAPVLLTVRETAARLRTSRASVYKLCELGQLPSVRVSSHALRIAEDDLARFTASRCKRAED